MDPFTYMKKILIATYGVEVCKHIRQLVMRHCCGCRNADDVKKTVDINVMVEWRKRYKTKTNTEKHQNLADQQSEKS